ncbi:MAG: hypothetical protein OEL84_10540 [Nitrosopumilus sp.]|nr:hypothetical protein [Nitrosopumilus sp.]MDH3341702.1 hypothetical protein [Nitrosopumilus sp.]
MTGKIENNTGMINQDTGMIDDTAGLIIDRTGLINDTKGTEYTASGRRKRSRERGKDSKPRNFPLHTMKNLPQFRDKPHEEVRQYIMETKGVDIGKNVSSLWIAVIAVMLLVAITSPLWIEKVVSWYNKKKKKGDSMINLSVYPFIHRCNVQ